MKESDVRKSAATSDYEGNEYGSVELGVADEVRVGRGSRSSLGFQNEAAHLQNGKNLAKTASQVYHAGKGLLKG
jgi:hypothetical protein